MKSLFSLVAICLLFVCSARGQAPVNDSLPYQKYPTLPAFNMRLMDSETIFNTYNIEKGRAVMFIMFSPDCKHCHAFFAKFLPAIDSFQNIDFYLVTPYSRMSEVRKFYEENHLGNYKNIKMVGRDYEFFCQHFYALTSVPDLMLYDKHKKLVKLFERPEKVSEIYEYTRRL